MLTPMKITLFSCMRFLDNSRIAAFNGENTCYKILKRRPKENNRRVGQKLEQTLLKITFLMNMWKGARPHCGSGIKAATGRRQQAIRRHRMEFAVIYARSLLLIHLVYSSVYLLISKS